MTQTIAGQLTQPVLKRHKKDTCNAPRFPLVEEHIFQEELPFRTGGTRRGQSALRSTELSEPLLPRSAAVKFATEQLGIGCDGTKTSTKEPEIGVTVPRLRRPVSILAATWMPGSRNDPTRTCIRAYCLDRHGARTLLETIKRPNDMELYYNQGFPVQSRAPTQRPLLFPVVAVTAVKCQARDLCHRDGWGEDDTQILSNATCL